mgnify:CR=1 FL=1
MKRIWASRAAFSSAEIGKRGSDTGASASGTAASTRGRRRYRPA